MTEDMDTANNILTTFFFYNSIILLVSETAEYVYRRKNVQIKYVRISTRMIFVLMKYILFLKISFFYFNTKSLRSCWNDFHFFPVFDEPKTFSCALQPQTFNWGDVQGIWMKTFTLSSFLSFLSSQRSPINQQRRFRYYFISI